jgi:CIC family chloride channel protein
VIGVPVVGAAVVAFLVKTFAPEAKGHGVPEVMSAIYTHDGNIRPIVAVIKSLASAMSIGSGGSVGREGPIIQIGAAFGSTAGQAIAMPQRQRAILIAAGAGAGIAATFNTPIGGIVFALELMLACVAPTSLFYVTVSCVTATAIGRHYFGAVPSFYVPTAVPADGAGEASVMLPCFVGFGLLVGLMAWLTTRGIYWFEDRFDAMPGNYYTRHLSGMLVVGLMIWGFATYSSAWFGQPDHFYVQGVGYATIVDVLDGRLTSVGFLLLLAFAKLLATCLTLGSGASGGVFSPCMFIGATLGAACAGALNLLVPGLDLNPVHFALAGMAAMVGGTTGAVLTSIIMIFEMTRDYAVILPVILTVASAAAVREWLLTPTIYTLKLLRRNEVVPQGLRAWQGELRCRHVMSREFVVVRVGEPGSEQAIDETVAQGKTPIVQAEGQAYHLLTGAGAKGPAALVLGEDDQLDQALRAMADAGSRLAVVRSTPTTDQPPEVLGVITDQEIAALSRKAARLMM